MPSRSGPPFSRSYGGILPSSLTMIHSIALVFSTYPPESVWGTGGSNLARSFSWQHRITLLPANAVTIRSQAYMRCGFTYTSPYTLRRGQPSPRGGYLPASLHRLSTTSSGHALHNTPPSEEIGTLLGTFSITRFDIVGSSPVREYQPVVHRLRLSASP